MKISVAGVVALALLLSLSASAYADSDDPPARVARISSVQGEVSFQPADSEDWTWASLNRPMTSGASLYTEDHGRAEVEIGSAVIRVGANTAVSLLDLNDRSAQFGINSGTAIFHVRDIPQGGFFEIDTPNAAVSLLQPGDYRISASDTGDATSVDVRSGKAEVTATNIAFRVTPGTEAQLTGTDQPTYNFYDLPPSDDLDRWSHMRDFRRAHIRSARYVPAGLPGVEDLDSGGTWIQDPSYGYVWQPQHVEADWTPYSHGHWAWIDPWGWSWIDDAPWGFTTSHYGRWAHAERGWVWVPPRAEEASVPVYSPANVVFLSGGGGGDVVSWAPLAPGEVYYPPYHYSNDYIARINGTNTFVHGPIREEREREGMTPRAFANAMIAGAVIAVGAEAFASSRNVDKAAVRVDPATLASRRVVQAAPVAPLKQSVLAAPADKPAGEAPKPPQQVLSRPLVAKTAPPPKPVPFEEKKNLLEQNKGKPIDPSQEKALQAKAAASAVPVKMITPPAQTLDAKQEAKKHRPAQMRGYGMIKPSENPASPAATAAPAANTTAPAGPGGGQQAPASPNVQDNAAGNTQENARQLQQDKKLRVQQQRLEQQQQADQQRAEERQKQEDAKQQKQADRQKQLEEKKQEQQQLEQQRAEERQKQEDAKQQEQADRQKQLEQKKQEQQQLQQQRADERQKQEDLKKQEQNPGQPQPGEEKQSTSPGASKEPASKEKQKQKQKQKEREKSSEGGDNANVQKEDQSQ